MKCSTPLRSLLVAVAVVACAAASTPGDVSAALARDTTLKAQKLVTIKFGLASVNMNYAPYIAGKNAGIFAKAGINLELVLTRDAATAHAAVNGGQTPIGAITTDAMAIAARATPQVAVLMPITRNTPYSLVVHPSIRSIADLRGKQLGASGLATADGGIIRAMLDYYDMQQGRDYTIVITGDPAARANALLNGQIFGIASPQPQLTTLKNQGFRELIRATNIPGLASRPFVMLAVNRKWAASHRATTVAFTKAWLTSVKYLYANPKRSIAFMAKDLNIPTEVMADAYGDWVTGQRVFPTTCVLADSALRQVILAQISLGNMTAPGPTPASMKLGGTYCQSALAKKK